MTSIPVPATRPENIEALSRNALMLHARILGIAGRSAMTGNDLAEQVAAIRFTLDDDLSRATRMYAPRVVHRKAQVLARAKIRKAGGDTSLIAAGAPAATAQRLFVEFGGRDYGYVPCVYCGLKLHYRTNPLGFEVLARDKIIDGDTWRLANVLPACRADNRRRLSAKMSQASLQSSGWRAIRSTTHRTTFVPRPAREYVPGSWGGMVAMRQARNVTSSEPTFPPTPSWKGSWRSRMSRRSVIGTSRSPAERWTRPPSSR